MKLAVTGCNGSVGSCVVALALKRQHTVVGIDLSKKIEQITHPRFTFVQSDLSDYDAALNAIQGCDGVIHLALFIPTPEGHKHKMHNSNVVMSWNVLRASAELGIARIAQASSVNVIAMHLSQGPHFEYFPIDETHPCLPDEPYGLSKVICELQADTIVRRYPSTRIASLRLHASVPNRLQALERHQTELKEVLWGYVQEDSVADAFLLAVTEEGGKWSGHEAFFIVAPTTTVEEDSEVLRNTYWPDVPIKGNANITGRKGFFSCDKAERLLGWVHRDDGI